MMKYLWRIANYMATWSEHRKAIKQLNQLSDKELKDIWINCVDIDRMVWLPEDKQERGK